MYDWLHDNLIALMIGTVIVLIVLVVIWGTIADEEAFTDHCRDLGGTVKKVTKNSVGVGGDGSAAVTSSTTLFCLSEDGRVLDIK